jgi:hypothetical protein
LKREIESIDTKALPNPGEGLVVSRNTYEVRIYLAAVAFLKSPALMMVI